MTEILRIALLATLGVLFVMPATAEDLRVASKVDTVTVFPSGAEVRRVARASLTGGEATIVFPDLPAETLPGSVRVEGTATAGLRIVSVDQRRLFVPQGSPEEQSSERRTVELELEKLNDQRERLQWRIDGASAQRSLLENLSRLPSVPQGDNGSGQGQPNWADLLALIGTGFDRVSGDLTAAKVELRDVDKRIADLQKRLQELAPKRVERTEVKVNVDAEAAIEADLTISYQVRQASWVPSYEARLSTQDSLKSARLTLVRRAAIKQTTGEDWTDVVIRLSTTRPSGGTTAPKLRPLIVDFQAPPKPIAPMATGQRFDDGVALEANQPEQDRRRFQAMRPGGGRAKVAAAPVEAKVEIAPFQAVFAVPGRASVASVGERRMLVITSDEMDARLEVRAVPKRQTTAYLYAIFKHADETPLLPGQVSLFRDGSFVGSGRMPLLAGEEHDLGFGSDDLVRVTYAVVGEKRGEAGLIATATTDEKNFKMTVTNQHNKAVDVVLLDQLPVARDKEIEVASKGRTRPSRESVDDQPGFVAWDLALQPGEEHQIDFSYVVRWPSDKKIVYRER